jgi:uncharacterized protein
VSNGAGRPVSIEDWQFVEGRSLATAERARLLVPVGILILLGVLNAGVLRWTLIAVAVAIPALTWYSLGRSARSWRFREREDDLLIEHGSLVRRQIVVPYGRMQFVDIKVGPVERSLGIATIQLHTASPKSGARIPGLLLEQAELLRDRLARRGEDRMARL